MAKGTRKKAIIIESITRTEAEEIFSEFATADSKEQEINALIEQRCTEIRTEYQEELAQLKQTKEDRFSKLQQYAQENRDEFGDKKSMGLTHGIIGFRTGQPKPKLLKGFKWETVTNLLKKHLPTYVRTTHEAAKDKLIADRKEPAVIKNLERCGLSIVQDETFFVEPKKEEVLNES